MARISPTWTCFAAFCLLLALHATLLSHTDASATVNTAPLNTASVTQARETGAHNHYIQGEEELPQPGGPQASASPLEPDESPKLVFSKREPGYSHGSVSASEGSNVVLTPQHLDFHDRPIGIPAMEVIEVRNRHKTEEMVISSISHDGSTFQLKFYRPVTVAPNGNVSLEVMFLPKATGAFESDIVLHTSCGTFVLQVAGIGTPNPYRVSPFISVKVPVGELFEPSIILYNPHYDLLSVKEIYTSSGFLHLQLPYEARNYTTETFETRGGTETRQLKYWDVRPHEYRPVIKLRFQSHKTGKFQGTVTIVTNADQLFIQVDVSVVSGTVHKIPEELDFGVLMLQETKILNLSLLNSGSTYLQVTDLHVTGSADPNLSIELLPSLLPPKHQAVVATLSYQTRNEGFYRGKLLLRTNDTNPAISRMDISYRVRVLSGSILYHSAQTTFAAIDTQLTSTGDLVKRGSLAPITQEIILTNKFNVPLVLYRAEIDDTQLQVVDFGPSQQAEPGESWPALTIEFIPKFNKLPLYTTHLHLITNATIISIPLHIYHGKLLYTLPAEVHRYSVGPLVGLKGSSAPPEPPSSSDASLVRLNKHAFDVQPFSISFGNIPLNEVQTHTLNVSNPNPVKLSLNGLWTDVEGLSIKLESVWNSLGYRSVATNTFKPHKPSIFEERPVTPSSNSATTLKSSEKKKGVKPKVQEMAKPQSHDVLEILPGQSILLSLELVSTREMTGEGYIYFSTQHERSAIRVKFQSLAGKLELVPEAFVFGQQLSSNAPLFIQHTYSRSITITSITSNDERLEVHIPKSSDSSIGSQDERHLWLQPNRKVSFGSVSFQPTIGPKSLAQVTVESDVVESKSSAADFLSVEDSTSLLKRVEEVSSANRQNMIRATLTVTTDMATTHDFSVQVQRWRPTLLSGISGLVDGSLDLGSAEVEVGETSLEFALQNPLSSNSVVVQLQLSAEAHLHPTSADTTADPSKAIKSCAGSFDFAPEGSTKHETLKAGETLHFGHIVFHPIFEGRCVTTLFIRNNLSLVETVTLQGVGTGGQLTFNLNSKPSPKRAVAEAFASLEGESDSSMVNANELLFKVRDSQLEGCEEADATESQSHTAQGAKSTNSRKAEWKPPVLTDTIYVYNHGNEPISVDSVVIAPKMPSGLIRSSSKSFLTLAHLLAVKEEIDVNSAITSLKASLSSSEANEMGGFTVVSADDVTSTTLWPGARRFIEISFSPDFSGKESEYDLVIRTKSSREFRFPLRGVISEERVEACGHRFTKSESGRKSGSLLDIRFGIIIVACLILLGMVYAERKRAATRNNDEQLPSLHTLKPTESNPIKNGHNLDSISSSRSKVVHQVPDDLESHSTPEPTLKPSTSPVATNVSKDKKKDKKDSKNTPSVSSDKSTQTSTKQKSSKPKDEKPSTQVTNPSPSMNGTAINTKASQTEQSANKAASPSTSPRSVVATAPHNTPQVGSGGSKRKDKKEQWPSANPVEPNFGPPSSTPSTDDKTPVKKELTSPVTSPNAEGPNSKRKKSLGTPSAPLAGENRETVSTGVSSPPAAASETSKHSDRDKSSQERKQGDKTTTEARQPSPPHQQRTQTLVPAKRPSSKPMPKYARKDGLNKDGTAAVSPQDAAQATVEVPIQKDRSTTASSTSTVKEGKKQRSKENKQLQQTLQGQQTTENRISTDSAIPRSNASANASTSSTKQGKNSESAQKLPAFDQPANGSANSTWSSTSPLLSPTGLPLLQIGPPLGGTHSKNSVFGSGLPSPGATPPGFGLLPGDSPLLASPGTLSANRYDFGRRGSNTLGARGVNGIPSSFDFSTAPSFDSGSVHSGSSTHRHSPSSSYLGGSLSRENSSTPPLPPMLRLYNPMDPTTGSVENLLASLRDPDMSGSESGSVSSTPRDYNSLLFNNLLLGGGHMPSSPSSGDSLMDPWQSLSHNSIWSTPTSERAVEENASNLSLLGFGAPLSTPLSAVPNHHTMHHGVDTSLLHPQRHTVEIPTNSLFGSPNSPTLPPGLTFPDHSATTSSPPPHTTTATDSVPQTHSSLFSSKLSDSGDIWTTPF